MLYMPMKCKFLIGLGLVFVLFQFCRAEVTYRIVDTAQGDCYGNRGSISPPRRGEAFYGQDAQYKGNQPSYRDNGDGTVTDLNTKLIWQKTPPGTLYRWSDAAGYAKNLKLAGHNDWRVPTMKELYSIVDFRGTMRTRTPYIDTKYFDFEYPDPSSGLRDMDVQYWSSNEYVGTTMHGDISAFGFNFADGRIKSYPTGKGRGPAKRTYIRCVRGGNGYGKNDFVGNKDGTITDRATGLMWTKADSKKTMNWQEALAYAENLKLAGYADWRLPNTKELHSIVDYSYAPDARDKTRRRAAIDSAFDLSDTESWFWTSTTHGDNLFGVYICFGRALAFDRRKGDFSMNAHGAGAQRSDPKAGNPLRFDRGLGPQGDLVRIYNYVRCVRDAADLAG